MRKCIAGLSDGPGILTIPPSCAAPKKAQKMSLNEFLGDSSEHPSYPDVIMEADSLLHSPGFLG